MATATLRRHTCTSAATLEGVRHPEIAGAFHGFATKTTNVASKPGHPDGGTPKNRCLEWLGQPDPCSGRKWLSFARCFLENIETGFASMYPGESKREIECPHALNTDVLRSAGETNIPFDKPTSTESQLFHENQVVARSEDTSLKRWRKQGICLAIMAPTSNQSFTTVLHESWATWLAALVT